MGCHQVDYTNSPSFIMQNEKAVSIYNTTQIDLQGQAASETDGQRLTQRAPAGSCSLVRGLRIEGRKVVHLSCVDVRETRGTEEPDCVSA